MIGSENNSKFVKDMGWYLLGTLIPMGVGFFKTPIFTRYFTPEEYGYLGLITITFSYFSVFLYSWLAGCLWRYYNAYKNKNDLKILYSNIFFVYLGASFILLIISGVWYVMADNPLVRQLILLSFILFFIKEFIGLYLIVIRLEGKALSYNLIHSIRAVLSFGLLYVMTFGYQYRITSVLLSTIFIDILVLIFILMFVRENLAFSIKSISRKTLKILYRFGSIGLVANFCFLLISSSDRYIIAMFGSMDDVGIYNQVYNICQLSVVALVTVFFNTVNPKLNKELEINFENSNRLNSTYLYVFLLFGLPIITYFSLFSEQMAFVLLGEKFRSGYTIMPYVFISAFLYGLFLFIEIKFKFAEKLKNIAIGMILASIINIGLNFIFIPIYGYKWAAITTFISYLLLFFYFYIQDSLGFLKNRNFVKKILLSLIILLIQVIIDLILRSFYTINVWFTIIEVTIFFVIYLGIFKNEIRSLKIPV
ncbi:MAG: oligosaccharide flippase family protein [Bacteroidales bacterium]|nr:oligosaccharide flippase family protein [Bacteroidales bacterium]